MGTKNEHGIDTDYTREAALGYIVKGWSVVPIAPGQKTPGVAGWPDLRIKAEDIDKHFPPGEPMNVGLILGQASGGLVDVDLDCEEAVALAPIFLPGTGMIHGRPGNPSSHWWYKLSGGTVGRAAFTGVGGGSIVEVRGDGHQTVVPPSLHPSGDLLAWVREGEPATVSLATLKRAVERLAAAVVLARAWPGEGSRHSAALALEGALARDGWDADDIEGFVRAVAEAGGDDEASERGRTASRSVERIEQGDATTGWPALGRIIGKDAARQARKHLGDEGKGKGKAKDGEDRRDAASSRIVAEAQAAGIELFHDPMKTPYAAIPEGGGRRIMRVRSSDFKQWLGQRMYGREKEVPNPAALDAALGTLAGLALFAGEQREVRIRVGGHAGRIYLDLGGDAVEVGPAGWRVVALPPVCFRRSQGMQPLPVPARGGDLGRLRDLLNLGGEDNFRKLVGWLLMALRPEGPYPLLVIHGEQGSAKSTLSRCLLSLIDPTRPALRSMPNGEQEMALWASSAWLLGMDNLSFLKAAESDLLCQMATGGGFATRRLYTDDEQALYDVSRPVLLNGIPAELASRPDLMDRALMVGLPPIPDGSRRSEGEVAAAFAEARPALLGSLLDAASCGLKEAGTFTLAGLPRMADFVLWVEACAPALGWPRGDFAEVLERARAETDRQAVGTWAVMAPLGRALGEGHGTVEGTVSEVLAILGKARQNVETVAQDWPRSAKALSAELRRHQPALRRLGIEIEWLGHHSRGNLVRISRRRVNKA